MVIEGRQVLMLGSNSYPDSPTTRKIKEAAAEAVARYGPDAPAHASSTEPSTCT